MNANYLFCFSDTENVSVNDCEVYDNYAQGIVYTVGTGNARLDRLNVHDNHLTSFFGGAGQAEINELSFENNSLDKWSAFSDSELNYTLDGEAVRESELNEKYGDQLSSAGVGAVEAERVTADTTGAKTVYVSTADEFIAAIASDTVIFINVPQIDLTAASTYGVDASKPYGEPEFAGKSCEWHGVYDGFELCIGGVNNLHITGISDCEIVTEPRYADVLGFYNCENISIVGVKLGHSKEQGLCAGGVLYLSDTEDIIIESCDLYGCGILGIETRNVSEAHVQNTLIHDCNQGAARLIDSQNVTFLGCTVENCPDAHFTLSNCTGFSWNKRLMDPYCAFNIE